MSNTIYKTKKQQFHYTYQITELSSNKKYIGVRTSNIDPIYDIGVKYFSSSIDKSFKDRQKQNPADYKYEVLSIHETREDASSEEARLHELYNVARSNDFYNKHNSATNIFDTLNKMVAKDASGNTFIIDKNDPRYLSGELVGSTKGQITVKDASGNTFKVNLDDTRYLSGELVALSKGQVTVKDSNGNTSRVSIDDARYLSGELVHHCKDQVTVKDKDGNTFNVAKDNPRYLSGELVGHTKGYINVKDINGDILKVSINDPRYLSGELVGILKNKVVVKDINNNKFTVSADDTRLLAGELIGHSGRWICIDNIVYSPKKVESIYNISYRTILRRCKSDKWPNWSFK